MDVGHMQRKLSRWAEQDAERRFYGLYALLYDITWLKEAHTSVSRNKGSQTQGCDGITMRDFDQNLEDNLRDLAEALKQETFAPHPVRRVYIEKTSGKGKRPLGIPSVRDRIVQEALRMVLEPICEADFVQDSFGFRPNRCTMDAIKRMIQPLNNVLKYFWIVEGDISSYFDTVHHRKLIKLLRRRIKDKKLLGLIWKFLKAGVVDRDVFHSTDRGVPQGGIVSPLLANVYLHELDLYMQKHYTGFSEYEKRKRRKAGRGNVVYVRYADDFVALCNGRKTEAEALRGDLHAFLKKELHLELSVEKTKITHLNDGFTFLGYELKRCLCGGGKKKLKLLIPRSAQRKVRAKLMRMTDESTSGDAVNAKLVALNRVIRGWCQYYRYCTNCTKVFNRLDHVVFWRMVHWLGRKFKISTPQVLRRYYRQEVSPKTLGTETYRLVRASSYKRRVYRPSFRKPNPYTSQVEIKREERPSETIWTGWSVRQDMMDLRPLMLKQNDYTCASCGHQDRTGKTLEVDHIRPYRKFKSATRANQLENLRVLCLRCHSAKTEQDHLGESRIP